MTFSDRLSASLAYQTWKIVPEWVAMFDYTSCAKTLTTIKVHDMRYDGEETVTFPNLEIDPRRVVDDFEFVRNHISKP